MNCLIPIKKEVFMNKQEEYFVIPEQFKDLFLDLEDKESGLLVTALSDYHFHGKQPRDLPARLEGIFSVLKIVTSKDFKL